MGRHPGTFTRLSLAASLLCLYGGAARATDAMPPVSPAERASRHEVEGGWPTDRTMTVAGRDFFQAFAASWQEQPLVERYPVVIRELPSARRGTQIIIETGQVRVYQGILPARRASIPAQAHDAAALAYQNVIDAEVRQLLFREADLAPDEI